DEHRRIRRRDSRHPGQDGSERLRRADELLEHRRLVDFFAKGEVLRAHSMYRVSQTSWLAERQHDDRPDRAAIAKHGPCHDADLAADRAGANGLLVPPGMPAAPPQR